MFDLKKRKFKLIFVIKETKVNAYRMQIAQRKTSELLVLKHLQFHEFAKFSNLCYFFPWQVVINIWQFHWVVFQQYESYNYYTAHCAHTPDKCRTRLQSKYWKNGASLWCSLNSLHWHFNFFYQIKSYILKIKSKLIFIRIMGWRALTTEWRCKNA